MISCADALTTFLDSLETVQKLEQYLNFEPVFDVQDKVADLKKLDTIHVQHLIESDNNGEKVEELVSDYNDIVGRISEMMVALENQGMKWLINNIINILNLYLT